MCMNTWLPIKKTAKVDMECYKIFGSYLYGKERDPIRTLSPLYRRGSMQYYLNETTSHVDITKTLTLAFTGIFSFNAGYHAFTTLSELNKFIKDDPDFMSDASFYKYAVARCIIPAGSTYYTGSWHKGGYANVVTSALCPVEILFEGK